ncbi:TonB-dependent receptor [Rubrolithibacter danxiaensis]|uniref:TonB-dependent receptor n=1 Tax=Rubrolithibacter danxiaensis TaxID=3390805 RepID=UPI003BF8A12E
MEKKKFAAALLFLIVIPLLFPMLLKAQSKGSATVSGYVRDAGTGETLIGVIVSIPGTTISGISNSYGFYSLSLKPGSYKVEARYMGFKSLQKSIDLKNNLTVNFDLSPSEIEMEEVVVSSEKENKSISQTQMGSLSVSIKSVKQLPALLGEADVIKTIQLLPGVTTVGEGAPGYNVRGGSVDQNLILLDEAAVYNGSHLFGFFSVFNPDAVKDLTLMKSEMPARYGGRLSSLLDVRMKEGNAKEYAVSGGIGTIATRLLAEGPIKKDKSSFIVAGRRSYVDLFLKASSDEQLKNTRVYFYDLSSKMNFKLGKNDRLFISGYFGRDVNKLAEQFSMDWGNATATMRWNHVYNPKLFSNISAIYSDYDYALGVEGQTANSFIWHADIKDWTLKSTWNWYPNPANTIYFGADAVRHNFSPGTARPTNSGSAINTIYMPKQAANDYSAFWDHDIKLSKSISFQYGLRYSGFQVLSAENTTVYNYAGEDGKRKTPVNPKTFTKGQTIKWYHNLEPRFTVKYQTNESSALKASYTRTAQNLHFVSNTIAASPLDIWIPSSVNVKPEVADQLSAGFFYNNNDKNWEASAEVYYRRMYNQIGFISGAEVLLNDQLEGDMLFGKGRAYGTEFFFRKNTGRATGWISYTLSRTERKINSINNNRYYPAKYDRTHSLSLVGIYDWKPRTSFSAVFNFATGTPATFPGSRFDFQGFPVQYNNTNSRNNYRVPSYHRLDLSVTLKGKEVDGRRYRSEFVIALYNAYGHKNPYSIFFRQNEKILSQTEAVRYSVIGSVVPSLTWNFKF